MLERADLLSQRAELFGQVMVRLPGNADRGRIRVDDGFRNGLADVSSLGVEGRRVSVLLRRGMIISPSWNMMPKSVSGFRRTGFKFRSKGPKILPF